MRPEEDEGSTKGCEFSNCYTVKPTVLTINDKVFRIIIRNRSFKVAFSVSRMDGEERVFESIRERARVVTHSDPRKQELRSLVDAPFVGLRAYSLPNRISKASWSLEPPTRLLNNSHTFVQPVTFSSHELDISRYSLYI